MGGPMPAPVDVAKLERVTDGMTLGAIVDELGPGWVSPSAGIITWFLSDGRELRIWPAEYKADEVITKMGESGRSRMWIQKSTHIRLNPTTAPATTQSS